MEWFRGWFGPLYQALYAHRDAREAGLQVDALLAATGRPRGRVLDAGCGAGRHLQAMLERGMDAWGVDLSEHLLGQVPSPVRGRVLRVDLRRTPFQARSFGLVANLFTGFGYLDRPADDRAFFASLARIVAPAGFLHLDLPDPDWTRAHLVPRDLRRLPGMWVEQVRTLESGCVVKRIRVRRDDGRAGVYLERVRLWNREDMEALARSEGLETVACFGAPDGRPHASGTPRMGFVWRRAGG